MNTLQTKAAKLKAIIQRKHLPGRHDQMTHGNRYGSDGNLKPRTNWKPPDGYIPPRHQKQKRKPKSKVKRGKLNLRENYWQGKIKEMLAKGVKTDQDAIQIGGIVRGEIEKVIAEKDNRANQIRDELINKSQIGKFDDEYNKLENEYYALLKEINDDHSGIVADILSQVRPLGNTGEQKWAKGSNKKVKEVVTEVSKNLPSDWLEKSNSTEMLTKKSKRGYYRKASNGYVKEPAQIAMDVMSNNVNKTATHEMGHRFEDVVPGIYELEKQFYDRRTAGEPVVRLKDVYPNHGYGPTEVTKKDDFTNAYMGKVYKDKFYEIFSMGLEGVFLKTNDLWSKDKEYVDFVLGVMAGV